VSGKQKGGVATARRGPKKAESRPRGKGSSRGKVRKDQRRMIGVGGNGVLTKSFLEGIKTKGGVGYRYKTVFTRQKTLISRSGR